MQRVDCPKCYRGLLSSLYEGPLFCNTCNGEFFAQIVNGEVVLKLHDPTLMLEESALHYQKVADAPSFPGMVFIPAGPYQLDEAEDVDPPNHIAFRWKTAETQAYYIDRTPVTNLQYKKFLDENPQHPVPFNTKQSATSNNWDPKKRTFPSGKENHPVVLVSFFDAVAYAKWAGKRLPTTQEWQKAARGVSRRRYPWGKNDPQENLCNMHRDGTTPVGMFSPQGDSLWGCSDMAGNVEDWISNDWKTDSNLPLSYNGRMKLYGGYGDGGEWTGQPRELHIPEFTPASTKWISIGFRCARDVF